MTKEQLDAIRARVDAATLGPWEPSSDTLTWIHVEAHGLTVAECRTYLNRQHTDEQNDANAAFIAKAREDVPTLLAEVERLRDAQAMAVQVSGELCEKCGWAMKFPEEPCRCELLDGTERQALLSEIGRLKAEVERLTADPLPAAAWVREVQQAAFSRGVAAMREALAECAAMAFTKTLTVRDIRAYPDPKDKS